MDTATTFQVMLLAGLVGGPLLFGALAWLAPAGRGRDTVICGTAGLTAAMGIAMVCLGSGRFVCTPVIQSAGEVMEAGLVVGILVLGFRQRFWWVVVAALVQALVILWEMLHRSAVAPAPSFLLDPLAATMVLIVSVIGSVIVVYAIGYMKRHEQHAPSTAASTGRFFFVLIGFLGLMNGLVLTDSLKCLAFFWEGTTLCSFFLIGHDGTREARANAARALTLNMLGGIALSMGGGLAHSEGIDGTLSGLVQGSALVPVALLVIATFTKSAQLPFQSWLLGAMVAPTPVSALLHSSTMVKAGSYLVLRLSPAFVNTPLASIVGLAGAFTFAVTSAMAISQSNAKKVLAYSTIANLGLIVACACINSPLAYAAALVVLIYHALSKALLFLCVGTVEQEIGSRDIDDMSGLMFRMPFTTTLAVLGMVSMMAPPFGMLLGKWMAVLAAGRTPLVLFLLVIGSALTIVFWGKWMGRIITTSWHEKYAMESLPSTMRSSLLLLALGVVLAGGAAVAIYREWVHPIALQTMANLELQPDSAMLLQTVDDFLRWPFYLLFAVLLAVAMISRTGFRKVHVKLPFLCGENVTEGTRKYLFRSTMDEKETAQVTSYYFAAWFGERVMTRWANFVAALILLSLLARMIPLWILI